MSGYNGSDFTVDQKRYLEGFVSGVQAARITKGLAPIGCNACDRHGDGTCPAAAPMGPDAAHLAAQDRFSAKARSSSPRRKPSGTSIRSTSTRG